MNPPDHHYWIYRDNLQPGVFYCTATTMVLDAARKRHGPMLVGRVDLSTEAHPDWLATLDSYGGEQSDPIGVGATQDQAIASLLESMEMKFDPSNPFTSTAI